MSAHLPATSFASACADVIARPGAQAAALFRFVADTLRDRAGARLVTITAVDPVELSYERLFSTDPVVYPVGGRKPANITAWSRTVMEQHDVFVANDYAALSAAMYDHETIRAIGCESIVNVPLVLAGRVIGTLNCLAGPGHFNDARVRACTDMRLPVLLGLLAHDRRTLQTGG